MPTVSEEIRALTRERGLPTRDCGHRIDLSDPSTTCKECEKVKQEIPSIEIRCDAFRNEDGGEDLCGCTRRVVNRETCKSFGGYFAIDCPKYNL